MTRSRVHRLKIPIYLLDSRHSRFPLKEIVLVEDLIKALSNGRVTLGKIEGGVFKETNVGITHSAIFIGIEPLKEET